MRLMLRFIRIIKTFFRTERRPLGLAKNTRLFNPLWGSAGPTIQRSDVMHR